MTDDQVSNASYHLLCYDEFEVQPIRQLVNRMKIQDARELGDQLADLVLS